MAQFNLEMMTESSEQSVGDACDDGVLRPVICHDDISFRGRSLGDEDRTKIRKALQDFHTLEIMAVTIYRFQITAEDSELNRELIAAMCNEMTHVQDFQVKLCEYGMKPSLLRGAYWIVGFVFGFGSRLLGQKAILKMGIWVETKAVHHYGQLLEGAPWDEATRAMIAKNGADEDGHIRMWKRLLGDRAV